ncbi:MAG TPA: hypothetical protein VF650_13480 [Allosphingosinicella sp.]
MLRRYVHGPGTDEPLVWYEGSGTSDRRFLHTDERGSVGAGRRRARNRSPPGRCYGLRAGGPLA